MSMQAPGLAITPSNVSLRGVDISFGATKVLTGLDLDVAQSEFLVLLGPSGCGKSTLLNAIAGLIDVSAGQIHIGGRNVTWEEPKDRGIAMVFQSYALYPRMSVRGNMSFGLKVAGMPKPDIEKRVAAAADMLRLKPLLDRKPAALSGGQRQRVAIGRALVREAPVFLFDEPLSNLDAQLRAELRVEIKRLHARIGATMIYVTHDQIEALTLADRIAVMDGGIIQQLDTPHAVYSKPASKFVASFVGSPAINFVAGRLVAGEGAPRFEGKDFSLSLSGYAFAAGPPPDKVGPGRAVTLGVRPEDIAAAAGSPITAEVEMIEPMGADTLVWARIGATPVSLRVGGQTTLGVGARVPLEMNPSQLSLFDDETGRRL